MSIGNYIDQWEEEKYEWFYYILNLPLRLIKKILKMTF